MAQKLYRVVETVWKGNSRVETDIGCEWKSESSAKTERKELTEKYPKRLFSVQPQSRK